MKNKNLILGAAAVGVIAIGGYYVYKYATRAQTAALNQQSQNNAISTATGLLDTIGQAGGVTGILGSVFGNVGNLFPTSSGSPSVQPNGTVTDGNSSYSSDLAVPVYA
jgi:hypothetical protein